MHRFAYILPLAAVGITAYLYKDILYTHRDICWIIPAITLGAELILYLLTKRAGKKAEYLSAYACNVQHHEAWTERVVRTETYTDREGRTQTRKEVRYIYHPECWYMVFNTGRWEGISENAYNKCINLWRTECKEIDPGHRNCVSGGGGQSYSWDGIYEHAACCTYKGLYVNYITNSRSIFRHERPLMGEQEELGLIHYPKFDKSYLDVDAVLVSDKLQNYKVDCDDQRAIQLINGIFGSSKQIHVFVLLFDGSQNIETALRQKAYWDGGNKNEFTICLGIVPNGENGYTVKWSKAFSWSDMPKLETACESWFLTNKDLDIQGYAKWLRANIDLWKRKEFEDFKYLGNKLSTGRTALIILTSLLLSAAILVISYYLFKDLPPQSIAPTNNSLIR